MKLVPPVQKNRKRCIIENVTCFRLSVFPRLGTDRRDGGCDGECSSCVAKPISADGFYKGKNVGVANTMERNLSVVNLIDTVKQALKNILSDAKFCHPYSRGCCHRGSVSGRGCHLSLRSLHTDRRGWFLDVRGMELREIIAWVSHT